ncbi:MAK10-like protein, partial [Tanacetum coccineum]
FLALGWHLEEIHVTWADLEKKQTRLRTYTKSLEEMCSQTRNWLERLPAGSISICEDLTTHFLAQFFPARKDRKTPQRYPYVPKTSKRISLRSMESFQGLTPKSPSSWHRSLAPKDLALYDNKSWNEPRDFAKLVKAISSPQDVPSTFDRWLIELKNQVKRLMEAHIAHMQHIQVNKITSSCEICSVSHDTQYYMENPKQTFVDYASSRTNEAGGKCQSNLEGLVSIFMASQKARLSKFKANFKQQQCKMTNKIDIILKAITDRMAGALPSDTIKNPKLNLRTKKNGSAFVQGEVSAKIEDPELFTLPCRLGDSKPFDTLADLGLCLNIILLYLFKMLNIRLLEEIDHIFRLVDGTKSYPVGIVKDVEVHIGKLKLLNDFYVIKMKNDPETPLLVGRGFLVTANGVIDCRKAKISVGEGITRSVFRVNGVDLGEEEAPYWSPI